MAGFINSTDKIQNRYWDNQRESYCVKVLPGQYYCTREKELIATTLGSCVSACIWDKKHKIGGMNHFMLPITEKKEGSVFWGDMPTDEARYGNYAMEYLINEMIKSGAEKEYFQIKLFGGGHIMEGFSDVGERNIDFILNYTATEGIELISQDLGGAYPRRVLFNPVTGKVWVKRVKDILANKLMANEKAYNREITTKPISGEIDLF